MTMKLTNISLFCLLLMTTAAFAGEADVIEVEVSRIGGDTYRLDVTVRHADEGWEHFANKWEVLAPNGTILGTRVLAHPHVEEQPFTRSLSGVKIPENLAEVIVRAHDLVHGYGGKKVTVAVPR